MRNDSRKILWLFAFWIKPRCSYKSRKLHYFSQNTAVLNMQDSWKLATVFQASFNLSELCRVEESIHKAKHACCMFVLRLWWIHGMTHRHALQETFWIHHILAELKYLNYYWNECILLMFLDMFQCFCVPSDNIFFLLFCGLALWETFCLFHCIIKSTLILKSIVTSLIIILIVWLF